MNVFTPRKTQEVLDTILFISIPEDMDSHIGDFHLDPHKMLPIEVTGDHEHWNIEELTWEMIISGMLKILAYQPTHEDAEYFRKFVLSVKPTLPGELTETAIIKANNGDFELAEEIFLALVGLEPNEQRPQLNLALLYDKKTETLKSLGNEEEAKFYEDGAYQWYKTLLSADEPLEEVYLYSGYFYLRIQNYQKALSSFEAYLEQGTDEQQINEVKKIVQSIQAQNLTDTQFKEAYDFILMSQEEKALEKIESFLKDNPHVWNGWFLKGWALRRLQQYDLALEAYDRCILEGGDTPDTLNEQAICYMETGNLTKAEEILLKALRKEPENTKIISNLGIVYLQLGDLDQSLQFFSTVLEFDPEDPLAQKYVQELSQ